MRKRLVIFSVAATFVELLKATGLSDVPIKSSQAGGITLEMAATKPCLIVAGFYSVGSHQAIVVTFVTVPHYLLLVKQVTMQTVNRFITCK